MNNKQQQLTFEKGITNVPSDNICSDNTLSVCKGLTYHDGEYHVIQDPVRQQQFPSNLTPDFTLLFVHTLPDGDKNYIYMWSSVNGDAENEYVLLLGSENASSSSSFTEIGISSLVKLSSSQIKAIGKTLIIATDTGLKYAIWKDNRYIVYNKIPEPDFGAWMRAANASSSGTGLRRLSVVSAASCADIFTGSGEGLHVHTDKQKAYTDLIVGLYRENESKVCDANGFCKPFFVRVALEMYDGSYTKIGNPILLFPAINHSTYFYVVDETLYCNTDYGLLYCYQLTDYTPFSDIIKNVTLFASEGAGLYDTNSIQGNTGYAGNVSYASDGIYFYNSSGYSDYRTISFASRSDSPYRMLMRHEDIDIISDLKSKSVFYKLCELGVSPATDINTKEKIQAHVVNNLTTQDQLPYDDFYSHCSLYPKNLYTYNSRLNMTNVKRNVFEGFDYFMPYDNSTENEYVAIVRIQTDSGVRYARKEFKTKQKQGQWFYYPDARAKWVTIWKKTSGSYTCILNTELEEHSGLSGAFYFRGMPNNTYTETSCSSENGMSYTTAQSTTPEYLQNQIVTSEVNNPWVFTAEGYNSIGNGEVLGISTQTQALSQGQFGAYPLLVFSSDGIWAMSVDNTGLYQSIKPLSREVCNNPDSITQTDGAVFFSSEKGLMVVVGSEVKCVSEQLSGKMQDDVMEGLSFHDFLEGCFIAYDYRDSLLWIFNPAKAVEAGFDNQCWVYNIKTGTFSLYDFSGIVTNIVNDYPDCLLQVNSGTYCHILSLTGRDNINEDTRTNYIASFTTRPLKLENGLALKSIMQMQHIYSGATLNISVQASNDLTTWTPLASPYLRGTPWKYYRFTYNLSDMKATATFSGTVLITQERRTNKLR